MKSNNLINNVKYVLDTFGKYIKNDWQLILLYWQRIDKVEMDKHSISTRSLLEKATNPADIISTKKLIEVMKEENLL